jgi:hypothetical protein
MTKEKFKQAVEEVFPSIENKSKNEVEDTPNIEVNWRVASTIKNLVSVFEEGNFEQKIIAQKIQEAENYWLENKDAIVEGVLNTADDVSKPGYVDGSNREVRKKLGEIVKELKNKQLEAKVRELMKSEMKQYFQDNQLRLAEVAIKNAPSLPSLFEVIKRFKKLDDNVRTYTREELVVQFMDILEADKKFTRMIDEYQTENKFPDMEEFRELYNKAMLACGDLPKSFNLEKIVAQKILDKAKFFNVINKNLIQENNKKVIINNESGKENQVKAKSSWTSKLVSGVKGWFNR